MSHRLTFFHLLHVLFLCWVVVLGVGCVCFCVGSRVLHVAEGVFLILIEDASRGPTMLNRSFGCAKKKSVF